MKYFLIILLALVSASYGQRQTVMVDTNGGVVFPTNFWQQAPVSTNVQEFIAPFSPISSNANRVFLSTINNLEIENSNSLQIAFPHALVKAGNDVFAFRRDAATGMTGDGSGVVFRNPTNNLTNFTSITITNGGALPDAVYDESNNLIYVLATGQFGNSSLGGGVYSINPSNLATTLLSTNTTDIGGAIAHYGEHVYIGGSNTISKIAKNDGSLVSTLTISNLGANSNNIHALKVTPDGQMLVGSTLLTSTNAAAFAVTLSNFAVTNVTFNTNSNFGIYTDDFAILDGVAYLAAEGGLGALVAYNLSNFTKTTLFNDQGTLYFAETDGTNIVFGGQKSILSYYNPEQNRLTEYKTDVSPINEATFIGDKLIATTYASNASLLVTKPSTTISPSYINIADVSGAVWAISSTSVVVSNTNTVSLLTDKDTRSLWVNISGTTDANVNILSIYNSATNQRKLNDRVVIKNDGTNTVNIRTGFAQTLVQSLSPQQQFEMIWVGQGQAGTNTSYWEIINSSSFGLGGGITTNRTFVSYDGTNYTTNSVSISNGIITGWTQ